MAKFVRYEPEHGALHTIKGDPPMGDLEYHRIPSDLWHELRKAENKLYDAKIDVATFITRGERTAKR